MVSDLIIGVRERLQTITQRVEETIEKIRARDPKTIEKYNLQDRGEEGIEDFIAGMRTGLEDQKKKTAAAINALKNLLPLLKQ